MLLAATEPARAGDRLGSAGRARRVPHGWRRPGGAGRRTSALGA